MALEEIPIGESSQIALVAYDLDQMMLLIQFRNNSIYEYQNVPGDIASGFRGALSPGQFFHQAIKGRFAYKRIA